MKKTFILVILSFVTLAESIIQAYPPFVFETVTTRDGLSSHDVRCIAQDKFGLMWFGTDEGVNRYDGTRFDIFKHTRSLQSGLNSSWINCIYEDSEGNLWIGTEKGVSIFDIETGKLEVLSDKNDAGKWLVSQRVSAFHENKDGSMWVGTRQGLIRYDRVCHKIEYFTFVTTSSHIFSNAVTCIKEDIHGNLWMGSFDGVWRYSPQTQTFEQFFANINLSQNNYIESIYLHPDDPEHIYLASSTGFTILDLDGKVVKHYDTQNSSICSNSVFCIIKYDDGILLIGTANGLVLFDMQSEQFTSVKSFSKSGNSLLSNNIKGLFEDNSGTIWVATTMGLAKLDRFRKPIDITLVTNSEGEELIYDVKRISEREFWMATENGIIISDEDFRELRRLGHETGLSHSVIRKIYKDTDGRIWVATNNGILLYNNKTDRFMEVQSPETIFKYVYDIKEDRQGRIITNTPNGICRITVPDNPECDMDFENIDISRYLSQDNTDIPFLGIDSKGVLWIGTICDGIIRMDTDGTIRQYKEKDGLSSDRIYCIFTDSKDNVWIGSERGISYISSKTGEARNFETDPYFSASTRTITQDENGVMWFATANYLIKYEPETGERVVCSLQEQLGIRELLHNSVCQHDGYIYMSGIGFVLKFKPEDIAVNSIAPPSVISNFTLTSMTRNGKSNTHQMYVTSQKDIRLKHNENSFRINFAMPYYISSDSNSYMYMLENHDKTWHTTDGKHNWVSYSNLKSGSYRFLVKGSNSDGVSSRETIALDITILPPWYASVWALILYIIAGAGLIFGIFLMVRSYYRNARKEKLNEMKMQFFTNISHEFRTPLSLIQGPVESLMNSVKDQGQLAQLNIIKQNGARLLDLINQIMDLRKIEFNRLDLKLNTIDIVLYTRQLADNFKIKAANKKIIYEFESSMESMMMAIDQRKYENILFNLISNAMKFTPEGGAVTIHLHMTDPQLDGREFIEVTVSDTGCGIRSENLGFIFEKFYQETGDHVPHESMKGSGIGLVIAKDYVELHGGTISVTSKLGEGSTFCFTIPTDLKCEEHQEEVSTIPEEQTAGNTMPHTIGNRPKIAIIEDDQDMLIFLKMILDTDYDVYTATDGTQGATMISDVLPDIILTDLMMSGMGGLELCRLMKGNPLTSHIPIVILTAQSSDDIHQQSYEMGADSYLTKPFSVKTLQTRLNTILENRMKLQDRYRKHFLTSPSELIINSQEDKFIHQLVKIVEDNMSDPEFGVQQLCAKMKYPYQQVYRKIKMLTGESLNEFIRNIRLKRAAQYLSNTDLRVSEVMYKVGFNSHSYFTKCFKEYFGVPPTEHHVEHINEETEK